MHRKYEVERSRGVARTRMFRESRRLARLCPRGLANRFWLQTCSGRSGAEALGEGSRYSPAQLIHSYGAELNHAGKAHGLCPSTRARAVVFCARGAHPCTCLAGAEGLVGRAERPEVAYIVLLCGASRRSCCVLLLDSGAALEALAGVHSALVLSREAHESAEKSCSRPSYAT